ncbi:MAG: hypothetical protein RLZZ476_1689 [Verrucomicrobiota bacterium]|jgi:hypothetical protein
MTETPPAPSTDPGRWIRAALVIFPAGTVLLGIASFGVWQWKKDQEEDRSFKYALALKREINLGSIERHTEVLRGVLKQKDALQAVPGYLQSIMGEENMGYTTRRQRFDRAGTECAVIDTELAGKKLWRDVNLVLVPYSENEESAALALAVMLSVAHELTGQPMLRTLRFAAVPRGEDALKLIAIKMREEGDRVLHLHVLGAMPEQLPELWNSKALGTVIDVPALPATPVDAVPFAQALKQKLLEETGQP